MTDAGAPDRSVRRRRLVGCGRRGHAWGGRRPRRWRRDRWLGAAVAALAALGPPRFVDETATAGIDHTYTGDFPYSVGGGLATFDCDGDGRPDLYISGGSGPASLYRNESQVGGPLQFTRVVDPVTDLAGVTGAYPIDMDGDGIGDLMVLRDGENVALRGTGGCRFQRANEALGTRRWEPDHDRVQRDVGGLGAPADPGLRRITSSTRTTSIRTTCAPTTSWSGPPRAPTGTTRRSP